MMRHPVCRVESSSRMRPTITHHTQREEERLGEDDAQCQARAKSDRQRPAGERPVRYCVSFR